MQNYQAEFLEAILENNSSKFPNIQIYHSNYLGRMLDTLKLLYPVTLKLVGDEFFECAAMHFALEHIPNKSHLNNYSFKFIKYISDAPQTAHLKYLRQFMFFEFMIDFSTHALKKCLLSDETSIIQKSVLRLNTDVHLIEADYNLDEIYDFCTGKFENAKIILSKHYYITFRSKLKGEFLKLDYNTYKMARLLHKNKKLTFDSIFSSLNIEEEDFANCLAHLLKNNLLVCDV